MFVHVDDYDLEDADESWARIPAMRHALTTFPECGYIWFLDQDAYIMEPTQSLEEKVLEPRLLGKKMRRGIPVAPSSIIKTFSHLRGVDIELVLTQDAEGLSTGSFVVRNGEWARFFLETWFDPLYRSYKFQKAEEHALVSLLCVSLPCLGASGLRHRLSLSLVAWLTRCVVRNIWFNGIRPSCPSWLLSRSG